MGGYKPTGECAHTGGHVDLQNMEGFLHVCGELSGRHFWCSMKLN